MLVLWAAVPWLYLNFGTWSFQRYLPLPADPRYIELVYPPLMLLSGVALSRAFASRASLARLAGVAFAVVMVSGVGVGLATRGRTAGADEMSVLREIVRAAQAARPQSIHTDDASWRRALRIFDESLVSESLEAATVEVVPDMWGLPSARPREPQPDPGGVR
jgi:hypothetical protein